MLPRGTGQHISLDGRVTAHQGLVWRVPALILLLFL